MSLSYSIAIRTLGTAGYRFKQELQSIEAQTVAPERVIVYIAEGYDRPDFTVGREEYVWVPKGMVAQRAIPYKEITSDYVLLLDDDMLLSPDLAERMLQAAEEHHTDCIGADSYHHYARTVAGKLYDFVTNLIIPHSSKSPWAFKVLRNGSFSFNSQPKPGYYDSQYIAGAVQLWRREVLTDIRLEDEIWLDRFVFAYSDDMLETYKLHVNGYKLGILFGLDVVHLDAGVGSVPYRATAKQFYVREASLFCLWWRMLYEPSHGLERLLRQISFGLKWIWLLLVHIICVLIKLDARVLYYFILGTTRAWIFLHSREYRQVPGYKLKNGCLCIENISNELLISVSH